MAKGAKGFGIRFSKLRGVQGKKRAGRPGKPKPARSIDNEAKRKWLHHRLKVLHKAFKKAKQFEIRKVSRRIQQAKDAASAPAGKVADLTKLEQQLLATKLADLDVLVRQASYQHGLVADGSAESGTPTTGNALFQGLPDPSSAQGVVLHRLMAASCVKKEITDAVMQFKGRFADVSAPAVDASDPPGLDSSDTGDADVDMPHEQSGEDQGMADVSDGELDASDPDAAGDALALLQRLKSRAAEGSDDDDAVSDEVLDGMDDEDGMPEAPASDSEQGDAPQGDASGSERGGSEGEGEEGEGGDSEGGPQGSFDSAEFDHWVAGGPAHASSGEEEEEEGDVESLPAAALAGAKRSMETGGSKQGGQPSAKRQRSESGAGGAAGSGPAGGAGSKASAGKAPAGTKGKGKAGGAPAAVGAGKAAKQAKKKNRLGQRERRRLAEQEHGAAARHVHVPKQPPANPHAPSQRLEAGAGAAPAVQSGGDAPETLHPSWAAKRQQKVVMPPVAGKKIVFSEDGGVVEVGGGDGGGGGTLAGMARAGPGAGAAGAQGVSKFGRGVAGDRGRGRGLGGRYEGGRGAGRYGNGKGPSGRLGPGQSMNGGRGADSGRFAGSARGRGGQAGMQGRGAARLGVGRGSAAGKVATKPSATDAQLHPSWIAKKQLAAKQPKLRLENIATKKIVFDE